jgi:pullulanase
MRPTPRLFHWIAVLAVLFTAFAPLRAVPVYAQDAGPKMVNIPGTHQDELGCSGEWQPACENTVLSYDAEDDVWQGTYEIQPANDGDKKGPRYKAALDGSWGVNYGQNATPGGADIPLVVKEPTKVKFYYDNKTHWITDSFNSVIVTAFGDFQQQLGCKANDDAGCLRSWLEDPDGDQTYGFSTTALKAGTYTVKFARNEDPANLIGDAMQFKVEKDNDEIYFGYNAAKNETIISTSGAPAGNLGKQKAFWVSADTLLIKPSTVPGATYAFVYSENAGLAITPKGVTGGTEIPLKMAAPKPDITLLRPYPYLYDTSVFRLEGRDGAARLDRAALVKILKGQVAVVTRSPEGREIDATGVQIPGVLDALFPYNGSLGVTVNSGLPTLHVWAPTAQQVTLLLFDDAVMTAPSRLPMTWDEATGVWSVTGEAGWMGKYYLYEVQVYVPSTGKIETNQVTDPYSFSLSMNSKRSQIVDLNDPALKPKDWQSLQKPALAAPEDIVIYELHIRDFSISDQSVPEALRGTYKAFTVKDSNGMKHLSALAKAGLTHIHLLPAFDIASVNEDKSTWKTVDAAALAKEPGDSTAQADAVTAISGTDGFNWGYDPLHYTVPEGSYSTDPNGPARIPEFRDMVHALNQSGLRVVMDVVYNHTNASGQSENSVLDRIVPGYYHRLNTEGGVEKSTCCDNTATEHNMMRKLMVDSVVTWATAYKVDGFRFDLMGHHMLADMQAVRSALDALTLEKDGVDGKSVYIYGEGWDFGEVANQGRGKNATQLNIAGTGIGVFNDRLRDAVRGGNPFDDPRFQGFATGLSLTNNAAEKRTAEEITARLNEYTDWIKIGLAGNLADYTITQADGKQVTGDAVSYGKVPTGYTADPQENIVYVSAHDNEIIFDAIQLKAPAEASLADRIRMNNLALSTVMFSQGVPFFHAGDDILRSKSLDRNSYDSGDWFNKLDWTYQSDNWAVGLPVGSSDRADIYKPLLGDAALMPTQKDIEGASAVFREFLSVRKSTPLFRLQTADQIQRMLTFLNNGPEQIPGLIVMHLVDTDKLDPAYSEVVVLFNARPEAVSFSDPALKGSYTLHPIQQKSADAVVKKAVYKGGKFTVPARTTAVFVLQRNAGYASTAIVASALAVLAVAIAAFFISKRRK